MTHPDADFIRTAAALVAANARVPEQRAGGAGMSETGEKDAPAVEYDAMRETLIEFALWGGDTREDAEWAAETYLNERAVLTLKSLRRTGP